MSITFVLCDLPVESRDNYKCDITQHIVIQSNVLIKLRFHRVHLPNHQKKLIINPEQYRYFD